MAVPVIVESEVLTGKSLRSQTCGMEFNASMVKAMTATLYDYKIEAVVREYSTNITDSHNDAGFEGLQGYVHIPTKMNPVVEFHDYGLGMDEDTVYDIFTVLGRSTKRGDNSTNGSLGLGSKSYATVSDQMTVTTVKDGIKIVVLCYMNKFGELAADLKSKESSNLPNQTIISIPVEINKVSQWQKAAAYVLGAFRVPHKVNTFGDYQEEYENMVALCKKCREEGSVFIENINPFIEEPRSKVMALMGDVAYHLPAFESLIKDTKVKQHAVGMIEDGLYMTSFDIGDLDHAPSREAISYDAVTFKKVQHRINSDIIKYTRNLQKEIGGTSKDRSFYLFWEKVGKGKGVLYESIKHISFPFLDDFRLESVHPSLKGSWSYKTIQFLDNESKFGKIRGYIPSSDKCSMVFSSVIHKMNQDRLLEITNPIIVYSETGKGVYKQKETLDNIYNHYQQNHCILYTERKECAENIAKWFGKDEASIICGDSFSPERVERKKGGGYKGGSYNIQEDFETVATVITIQPDGYKKKREKVNLKEEGVYYIENESFKVSGWVKDREEYFSINSAYTRNLLRHTDAKKIVIMNKNNTGKITRAGVPQLEPLIVDFIKTYKTQYIKYRVWKNNLNLNTAEDIIGKKFKEYHTITNNYEKYGNHRLPQIEVLDCFNSNFGFDSTPLWKKEVERRDNLKNKLASKTRDVKEKLPLISIMNRASRESIEYYLRLEKVIK